MLEDMWPWSKPVHSQLDVTEDEATDFILTIPKHGTAASYISHLKLACALARRPTDWDGQRLRAALKSKLIGTPIDIKKTRWVLRKDMLVLMMARFRYQGQEWLRILILIAFVFQFRVSSEYLVIRYVDIVFEGLHLPPGTQMLKITLDERKNRRYRHTLERPCTCVIPPKKGQVALGAELCVVHQFAEYLRNDPYYHLARRTDSTHLVVGGVLDHAAIIPALKNCARDCGDVDWRTAATHGPRRGFPSEMAVAGAKLKEILEAGDWRSPAFQDYIESVKDQLLSKAVTQMVGEASDEEDGE